MGNQRGLLGAANGRSPQTCTVCPSCWAPHQVMIINDAPLYRDITAQQSHHKVGCVYKNVPNKAGLKPSRAVWR